MRHAWSMMLAVTSACASGGGTRTAQQPAPVQPAPTPAPAATPTSQDAESTSVNRLQYPSTYQRHPNPPVLIRNATIMTATGQEIPNGAILFKDGRIVAVGTKVDDASVLDRKSTRLNSSHPSISYAVFCLKKKKKQNTSKYTSIESKHTKQEHTETAP